MTQTTEKLFLFLIVYLIGGIVNARVYHWPSFCESGTLKVINSGSESGAIWLQKFVPQLDSETEYFTNAHSTSVIKIQNTAHTDRFSLLSYLKTDLTVSYECGSVNYQAGVIDGGRLSFFRGPDRENKLWLQNLYTAENAVKINYLGTAGNFIKSEIVKLAGSENRTYLVPAEIKWRSLRIESDNKLVTYLVTENRTRSPDLAEPLAQNIDATARYFLVAPRDGVGDSFVAKISDPAMIQRAVELIKNPDAEKMMFASIQKNHRGFNRNFNNITKNQWSWSVTEVTNFADFGSTACNGNPQVVEDRLDQWLENPGRICFWDYRIKEELSLEEVRSGIRNSKLKITSAVAR